ncbi:KpsF/GutQ family sugar-phosphate isomerase [Sphingomonas aliaeris]|uniref:KpsF/GutQ family sugar-phosphate isomerase n=1 Tax=Sphingomonas aliaeris TaxID=2759526 RepID=A0A974S2X7_9SPHN|nr:KpsF/GutQ family sugar-phosphate isomerase [Sphingomonas aliaeris]QQV75973.1 KpsF/GutQ family sugar-phosphate isomerase [Sphingomonas aliaeris]
MSRSAAVVAPRSFVKHASVEWFTEVIACERRALERFEHDIPDDVSASVDLLAASLQPILCIGIGKSGLVAAKVAASFSSLGTPAFFVNAAEAAHGDLGAIQPGSVVLLFSNSGSTEEILRILPSLKARDCVLIGIIGCAASPIGRLVDHAILAAVECEADHIGMAPSASTTLQMAIGDALAISASRARAFTRADFLRHHPAGALGRQMTPIRAIMKTGPDVPRVLPSASMAELLAVMSGGQMGAACVVDHSSVLLGLVVDGDIRRHLQARHDVYSTPARTVMKSDPRVIAPDATVGDAMLALRGVGTGVLVLPVVDHDRRLHGLVHSNDIMIG